MKARIQDATVKPVLSGPRIERTSSIKRTTVKVQFNGLLSFPYVLVVVHGNTVFLSSRPFKPPFRGLLILTNVIGPF